MRMVTETVEMVVRMKIEYDSDREGAREHIIAQLPGLVEHVDRVGGSRGCGVFSAKVLSSSVVAEVHT